jgi:hypothetical protein
MTDPMQEPVALALTEIVEASSGTELRNIVLSHPAMLAVDLTVLCGFLREFGKQAGGGHVVTAALEHRARVLERLNNGGLASMTPESWSGNPDHDWVVPFSLARILDEVAARLYLAANQPGTVTAEDVVEACRRAYDHPAMADAPAIVWAGVSRDLAVALRLQLRTKPDADMEREAARLESEARDFGFTF